jgi:hypothetical protein
MKEVRCAIYQSLTKREPGFYNSFSRMPYASDMHPFSGEGAPTPTTSVSVGEALLDLLRNPWRHFVLRWNGKSALLSALFRGAIFLCASVKSHHAGRSSGILAEALYGAVSAGFFGTLTQSLRFAEPEWLAELLLAGLFPLAFQIGDYCFHAALGTQVFLIGMVSSAVFTVFSSLFNLYVMRRGTLLIGAEGKPFGEDLGALPKLALLFVVSGVMKGWRFAAGLFRTSPEETVTGEAVAPDSIASS